MNTEINIYKDGAWVSLDLFEGAGVAMNYSANDLGEFEERAGDYSQEVSLPRSPRNMVLLGIPLLPDGTGDTPYKAYECEVLEGGVPIVEIGAKLEIISLEDDSISVQIVGNAIDLADTLENTPMATEEGDGFWFEWTAQNLAYTNGTTIADGAVRFRLCEQTMATEPTNLNSPAMYPATFMNDPARVYPFLNLFDLVQWILKSEGWALELEGVAEKEWRETPILDAMFAGCVCITEDALVGAGTATASVTFSGYSQVVAGESETAAQWVYSSNPTRFFSADSRGWTAQLFAVSGGEIRLVIDGTLTLTAGSASNYRCTMNIGGTGGGTIEFEAGQKVHQTFYLSVSAGQIITISVVIEQIIYEDSQGVQLDFTLTARQTMTVGSLDAGDEPVQGGVYDLLQCLGFDNRLEPVQEFMRLLGLTLHLEYRTKTAYMYTMGAVYEKATETEAYDWSGKLTQGNRSFTFAPDDYARANTMKFAENEDENYTDEYVFNIENDALEKEKDIFESKFLSVRNYVKDSGVNIGMYDYDDDGNLSYNSLDKPVLVGIATGAGRVTVSLEGLDGATYNTYLYESAAVVMAWFGQSLYERLIIMLQEWRGVEAVFALTAIDLNKIDLAKPVWIEEFGHYYYIRSIDNFTAGQLTTVQLAKLK